jgi:hypothetical protein
LGFRALTRYDVRHIKKQKRLYYRYTDVYSRTVDQEAAHHQQQKRRRLIAVFRKISFTMTFALLCVFFLFAIESHRSFGLPGGAFSAPDLSHVHEDDRLGKFYKRIAQSDVKYCDDRTKLLPSCSQCIPGLQSSGNAGSSCDQYIAPSRSIRDEIKKLVIERFGEMPTNRTYGLYPCKFVHSLYFIMGSFDSHAAIFF